MCEEGKENEKIEKGRKQNTRQKEKKSSKDGKEIDENKRSRETGMAVEVFKEIIAPLLADRI
jgi:hypothetical protein